MNINTKLVLASTLLTAVFAGQAALAGDNDYLHADSAYTNTESVVMQKASYQAPSADVEITLENSSK